MKRAMLILAVVGMPAEAQQANGERPVAAGVYTDSQAVKGQEMFQATCSACHVPSDHTGEQFKLNWFGRTVLDYFVSLKKTMPEDNPGGLSDDEYTRVIAYILQINGYPAGQEPLPADTAAMQLLRIGPPADTVKPRTARTARTARSR